jgi:hypothetical protein
MDYGSSEHLWTFTNASGQSEQSRRLAWQVLQEIHLVLEMLGDQRIPYEVRGIERVEFLKKQRRCR